MMFNNALRRFWPPMGGPNIGPMGAGMLNPIPFEGGMPPTPDKQPWFNPMPFEGGMPNQGKGGLNGPFSGPFNVPNSLMGYGGGYRGSGMGIRQRY